MYGRKYPFRNPLKQNYGHVKALQALLGLPETTFIPIVVFSVNSELKVKTKQLVVYTVNLKNTILLFTERKLNIMDLDGIVNKITNSNVDSRENRKAHVENIYKNVQSDRMKVNTDIH